MEWGGRRRCGGRCKIMGGYRKKERKTGGKWIGCVCAKINEGHSPAELPSSHRQMVIFSGG